MKELFSGIPVLAIPCFDRPERILRITHPGGIFIPTASCFVVRRSWRDSRDQPVESRSVLLRAHFDYSEEIPNCRWNLHLRYLNIPKGVEVSLLLTVCDLVGIFNFDSDSAFVSFNRYRVYNFAWNSRSWRTSERYLASVLSRVVLHLHLGEKLDRCALLRRWCVTSSSLPFLLCSSTEHRDHRSSTRTTKWWVILSSYLYWLKLPQSGS